MFIYKVIAGALVGAAVGLLIGRTKVCSSQGCNVRTNRLATLLAATVLGAAVAAWLASPAG